MFLKEMVNLVVEFKTENCIKEYKNNRKERIHIRGTVKSCLNNNIPLAGSRFEDLRHTFKIIWITVFSILSIHAIKTNNFDKELIYILVFYFIVSVVPSMIFLNMQCKYLLSVFRKIDEIDSDKDVNLKNDIAACNLYLK